MFNAILVCALGILMVVAANRWVLHLPFARLAVGLTFYINTGGILCIVASVFMFAGADRPSFPTFSFNTNDAEMVAAFFGVIAGMGALVWYSVHSTNRKRSTDPVFECGYVTLSVDEKNGTLHVFHPTDVTPKVLSLANVGVETQFFGKGEGKNTDSKTSIVAWPASKSGMLNPWTARDRAEKIMDVWAPMHVGKAIEAWVKKHPIGPDWTNHNATWKKETDDLLRYCREQRSARGRPAIECWRFEDGPSIEYIIIEQDGTAMIAEGVSPHLEPVQGLSAREQKLSVRVSGHNLDFKLTYDQIREIQRLQANGKLRLS